jgi:photosystem II stability/assembly factor-like uncharacterized protein
MNVIPKISITLLLLLIFISPTFFGVFAQDDVKWEILNGSFGNSIENLDFVNEEIGWLTGYNSLSITIDGGETWKLIQLPDDIYFYNFDFTSDSIGWAYAAEPDNDYRIYKTNNGGRSWTMSYDLPDNYFVQNFSAVNDDVIFIVGLKIQTDFCSGWVLKSLDGGLNWQFITPPIVENQLDFESIYFFDENKGFVTGRCNNNVEILKTVNGGKTWRKQTSGQLNSLWGVQFVDDAIGYFLAYQEIQNEYYFCVTTDTFNTWTIKTNQADYIHSFFILDDKTIFAIVEDDLTTKVMKSTDDGLNWEKKQDIWGGISGRGRGRSNLYFSSKNIGFIYNRQSIYRSIDSGENWSMYKLYYPFSDIFFIDKNLGFASGGGRGGHFLFGDLFFTSDGGQTWQNKFGNYGWGPLSSTLFINESLGFLLAHYKIYKSIDTGVHWNIVYEDDISSTGYSFRCNELFFSNESIGWVVGKTWWSDDSSGAAILSTVDGGENWDLVWKYPQSGDTQYELTSIHSVGTKTWAVGESGLMVIYTEQDQWQVVKGVTDLPLKDVFFSDDDHGWIAGGYFDTESEYLLLLKTTDGGESWEEIPDFNYQINDMFFKDSLHGWAVGNDTRYTDYWPSGRGIILTTADGGKNWTTQVEDLLAPLNALHFKDGYGWAVGEKGLILRTKDGVGWVDQNTRNIYPNKFSLSQNYPNPFNPKTVISYQLPVISDVELSIFNLLGQKMATLVSKKQSAGYHQIDWDASGFASGVYYYQLHTDAGFTQTRKMILLR